MNSCGKSDNPIDQFEKSRPGSVKAFYAYPSTVRMLGKIVDKDNPDRFSEIEKARLYIEWKSEGKGSRDEFLSVKNNALAANFEELLSISSENSDITVLLNDRQTPVYLLFSFSGDVDYIIEMKGNVSMSTLQEMGTLDMNNVADVINLGKGSKEENSEIQEN